MPRHHKLTADSYAALHIVVEAALDLTAETGDPYDCTVRIWRDSRGRIRSELAAGAHGELPSQLVTLEHTSIPA